ncbi:fanconi-associated nuclease 1 [Nematostella vectensis]|uniref:fanconi-associated nuclease 1 n=1 Tax=Nematostella vectensis TaxID=45351 RepID=UPI002077001D|nr:fanconi-associated nuclease 1 [Nematostella vectensis]
MDKNKRKRLNLSLSRKKSRPNEPDNDKNQELSKGKANGSSKPKNVSSKSANETSTTPNSSSSRSIFQMLKNPPSTRTVNCPICSSRVQMASINTHLDSGCNKFGNELNTSIKSGIGVEKRINKLDVHKHNDDNKVTKDLDNIKDQHRITPKCVSNTTITTVEISDDDDVNNDYDYVNANHDDDKGDDTYAVNKLKTQGNTIIFSIENKIMHNSQISFNGASKVQPNSNVTETIDEERDSADNYCNQQKTIDSSENDCTGENVFKDSSSKEDSTEETNDSPYYLSNFKLVLDTVMSDMRDQSLFDDSDNKTIEIFKRLSPEAQKLYVRLFQRKFGWFRCSKLDYPRISGDLTPVLKELIGVGFLKDGSHLKELRETLKLLPAPDLRNLVASFNVMSKTTLQKGQNKAILIEALVRYGETQRSLFGSCSAVLLKRAKQALGDCVHVSKEPRSVFARALLLFSMNVLPDDEDNRSNGQQQQLSTIFLVNVGKLTYPTYTITRELAVFPTREHLISYAAAFQEKHEMFTALEVASDLDSAYKCYPKAAEMFSGILHSLEKGTTPYSATLPPHLRCFSAEWVYTRMCYLGVEVLQKMRQYEEAVNQLELLLKQRVYCADCRGRWWDRLALNLHQHLKQPEKALNAVRQALADDDVRFGHRLALIQRAKKILSSAWYKKKKDTISCEIDDTLLIEPQPCNTVTISGKRSAQMGVFIAPEVSRMGEVLPDTVTFCGVEEYALSYYRQQGYDEGIHGETGTFLTLYGLLFWEVIFCDGVKDVFRVPYQSSPLDMNYDSFYQNRQAIVDQRLNEIRESSSESLQKMVEWSWTQHEGQVCACVSWDRFTGVNQAKQLVACFGGPLLCGIFKHFATNLRHRHSGMPDLVVWNSSTFEYRIVEVKGPGDRLSTKQLIWLGDLASLGATVEVCYVTAVGGKLLQVST